MRYLVIGTILLVWMAVPAFAQFENSGYHEVYEWTPDGWAINPEQHGELYGEESEHNQYRWESNPAAQICQPPYYAPEPEPPLVKIIEDEAVLFPWIDFNVYEKDIHWDLFKSGVYMGKTFQVFMKANAPIQILFGCGTMEYPIGFDPDANEIIWDVDDFGECLTDKIRLHSILNKEENVTVDEDWIEEYLWWYEALDRPDPHRIHPEFEPVPPPYGDPAWRYAPDLNGMAWIYPDSDELHRGWWVQFFEYLRVEDCDSEGKYYKEIHLTVAPDP